MGQAGVSEWDISIEANTITPWTMAKEPDDSDSLMRQRLLYAEEVYLYKIPPMKDANGHRFVQIHIRELPLTIIIANRYLTIPEQKIGILQALSRRVLF